MPNHSVPPSAAASPTGSSTYLALTLTSGALALLAAPQLLASVGLVSDESLLSWMQVLGMLLALPLIILVAVTVSLSLDGLVRGPPVLRMRLVAWWVVGAGGGALAYALEQAPGFNPYLGTPQPAFGVSDALVALCLGLCVFLAARWFALSLRENHTA